MGKTLLFRLFGMGRFSGTLKTELEREHVLWLEEGIPGSATFRNFRSPSSRSNWRRQWYTASIVLTESRL